jgi:OOP family OmpA-OmpF porin
VNFLFLAAMLWVFLALRDRYRSNQLLAILRKEPGITVTNADWHFGRFTVYGLRDPMSHDPYTLVAKASLQPQTVEFHLEPYQSLDPAFTAQRRLAAERQSIETTVLRFESGSAVLLGSALDRLEEMVPHLKALFEAAAATGQSAKVEVLGHTDSTGADDTNALLAVARAAAVVAQMRSLGIAENQFLERGVGDRQPLRTGSGPRDQSFNRSVSFRIMLAGH